MVDAPLHSSEPIPPVRPASLFRRLVAAPPRRRTATGLLALLLLGATALTIGLQQPGSPSDSTSNASIPAHTATPVQRASHPRHIDHAAVAATKSTPTTSPAPVATLAAPVPTSKAVAAASIPAPAAVAPSVTALVAEVEAAGIEPGSNWTWSMGQTATMCGPIAGAGTGCTFGAAGREQTVFTGTPTLALVAHELANAETQNDAIPSLLSEVAAAEAGTSWSPTDAVASCLVAHFMGFQDLAAGTWQCPAVLATVVAENIHNTVAPTAGITFTCGATSGLTSTLTFTSPTASLTVTAPAVGSVPQTVAAGTPIALSGIGTFTALSSGAIDYAGSCAL